MIQEGQIVLFRFPYAGQDEFIKFFDKQEQKGNLLVSSISFWEIALWVKKGRIEISDIQ